jgi:chromosome partitioning protein
VESTVKIICFFNNKGGVGKTSLVYHLAWKMAELGYRVVAADLDPQANLSTMFLGEEELVEMFEAKDAVRTVYQAVKPLTGIGDVGKVMPRKFNQRLALLPGDIGLSVFEDALSKNWTECLDQDIRPFYVITAFHRVLMQGAKARDADVVLVDVGPNLGAINRAALLAADHVIFPVGADLFSLYGLRNLGPRMAAWREEWSQRRENFEKRHAGAPLELPAGQMAPSGYVTTQHSQYAGRPSQAYDKWLNRVPEVYLREVCRDTSKSIPPLAQDRNCLARIKHYRSLMPMAQEARKPMFQLTPADGAIGSHSYAARDCGEDFRKLADVIAERCDIQRSDDQRSDEA